MIIFKFNFFIYTLIIFFKNFNMNRFTVNIFIDQLYKVYKAILEVGKNLLI